MSTFAFFLLFIEALSAAILQNNKIQGIQAMDGQHKISLYADDLLRYLQNPYIFLQESFNIINKFSQISHYTINWSYSTQMMPGTLELRISLSPFTLVT